MLIVRSGYTLKLSST